MSSQTSICNMALTAIGMKTISNINDTTVRANACLAFWDDAADDAFSEHRWSFATAIELLVAKTYSFPQWQFTYAIPVFSKRVWTVFGITGGLQVNPNDGTMDFIQSTSDEETQEFETLYIPIDNVRVIASNEQNAYCRYTYKVSDVTIWTPKFCIAFAFKLAALIAPTLTGDGSKAITMLQMYGGLINEEKRIGESEKIKKPTQSSGYQRSRG